MMTRHIVHLPAVHVGRILQAKHGEGLPRVNGGFTECNPNLTTSLITITNYSSEDEKEEDVLMVVVVEIPPPPLQPALITPLFIIVSYHILEY